MNIKSLGKSLFALPTLMRYKANPRSAEHGDPTLQVTLDEFCYSRYFYSLIKCFKVSGYSIRINAPLATIYSLNQSGYSQMIFTEGLVSLGTFEKPKIALGGSGKSLVPYNFLGHGETSVFDVPMLQHPMMYAMGYWDQPVGRQRAHSAIFIGNGKDCSYSRPENEELFHVINRMKLLAMLRGNRRACEVASEKDLHHASSGRIMIADSKNCGVPMERFRNTLGSFRFFVAAPGAFMPLCHNLIEAMSVGCIPILQRNYANLLPGLKGGENSIIFDDERDFHESIEIALSLPESVAQRMSDQVDSFYNKNFSPSSIVDRIADDGTKVVRLLAGERSLARFREARIA